MAQSTSTIYIHINLCIGLRWYPLKPNTFRHILEERRRRNEEAFRVFAQRAAREAKEKELQGEELVKQLRLKEHQPHPVKGLIFHLRCFFWYPGPGSSWEGQGRRAGKAKGPRAATGTTSEAAERSRCGGQATVRKGGMSWGGGLKRIVMVEVSSFCRFHWQTCELKMGGVNIPSNLMPTQTVNPSQARAPARHSSSARRRAGRQGSRRGGCATAPCDRAQPQAPGWRSSGKATRLQGWRWATWWICKRCIFFTWCVTMRYHVMFFGNPTVMAQTGNDMFEELVTCECLGSKRPAPFCREFGFGPWLLFL